MNTGEKVASIKKGSNKTTVPIPINTITKMTPPANTGVNDGGVGTTEVVSSGSILGMVITINTLYT